jgi:DNA-binding beta-propeller fold protein YncE
MFIRSGDANEEPPEVYYSIRLETPGNRGYIGLVRSLGIAAIALFSSALSLQAGSVWYALAWRGTPSTFGTIDPNTGTVTSLGITPVNLGRDIAVSPTGQVYGIFGESDETLYTIDKNTGATAVVGALPAGVHTLAFRPDGALFGASLTEVYSLNPASGAGTLLGLPGFNMDNLRFDSAGNLYVMSAEPASRLFTLNQTTAAATLLGDSGVDDISLGGYLDGAFLGTHDNAGPRLVSINPLNGAAIEGAFTGGNIYVIALDPTSVPEPGTLVLLTAGLAVLFCFSRRPRASAS